MESNASLKSDLRGHGHRNETEAITSDVKGKQATLFWVRCDNHHVLIYIEINDDDRHLDL